MEMVLTGITEPTEVKRALRHYVTSQLCSELNINPAKTDRAFYPTTVDVRNHIHTAKLGLQLSKLDQENLHLLIEKWRRKEPTSNFFFRPYKKNTTISSTTTVPTTVPTTVSSTTAVPTTIPTTVPTTVSSTTAVPTTIPTTVPTIVSTTVQTIPSIVPSKTTIPTSIPSTTTIPTTVPSTPRFVHNFADQTTAGLTPFSTEDYEQTLLVVHQEMWQGELLQKYGNTITLMDATYKTTRYDLAPFFICV